jgi:hypothetical protein
MSTAKEPPSRYEAVTLDTTVAQQPRLVIQVPPDQERAVRAALEALSHKEAGISAQAVVLDALRAAAEQTYFWTPEWQAQESAADQAAAEGRAETFNTIDEMLDFLDAQ